jgi:amino-acid N-acetyltransferase
LEDLGEGVDLYVARDEERIVGAIGLEGNAPDVLLRSLVVAPAVRGNGVGRALVEHAEREARARGVRALHLLTTTAESFFARAGYVRADRAAAPASIRATQEFRTLCPDSAACMRRELAPA